MAGAVPFTPSSPEYTPFSPEYTEATPMPHPRDVVLCFAHQPFQPVPTTTSLWRGDCEPINLQAFVHVLDRGFDAFLWAVLVVAVFMLVWYLFAGMVADLALLCNGIIIFGVMAMMQGTFTLPGLAGVVLTMGMAVDANIIVFERIREEIRAGRSPRAAVDTGYAKAMSTILDANITTALAGIILLNYTSGPIRGFAVTLLMGIVCSVFTAVYVCHRIFNWYLEARSPETLSI